MSSNVSARGLSFNHPATTLLPFLYKTKTLQSYRLSHRLPSTLIAREPFHSTSRSFLRARPLRTGSGPSYNISRYPEHNPKTIGPDHEEGDHPSGLIIRRVGGKVRDGAKLKDVDEEISWEVDPREVRAAKSSVTIKPGGLDQEGDEVDFLSIQDPFALEDDFSIIDPDMPDYASESTARSGESTITIAERETFERIFSDIAARTKKMDADTFTSETRISEPSSARGAGQQKQTLENVMDDALKKTSEYSANSLKHQEMRDAVERFPHALRAKAAEALGIRLGRSIVPLKSEEADELEQLRQPERDRVEGLMRAAENDIELWKVMEREVFSLVEKLGLSDPMLPLKAPRQKGKKKTEEVELPKIVEQEDIKDGADGNQLSLYGPLYPSYLLLGLRLFDRSFEKPSHLVLNVLPRIKSLGIISHVLGGSTPLYNELLRIYQTRYDNYSGMISLLEEMERAGLELDKETLEIVKGVKRFQIEARKGTNGQIVKALFQFPEFAPRAFDSWALKIKDNLNAGDHLTREALMFT